MSLAANQASVHLWFETVFVPGAGPVLRGEWETNPARARQLSIIGQMTKATTYIEDAGGGVDTFMPDIEEDWDFKHRPDEPEYEDPWVALPTVDAEGNDLDKGIPNFGDEDPDNPANWETEPVLGGTPERIYFRGTPMPKISGIRQATWRQAWGKFGFDNAPPQIIDGCPNPATGRWLNSVALGTSENDDEFVIRFRCKMRRIDQLDLAQEYHEEWWYTSTWDKATSLWTNHLDTIAQLRQTYHGPTVVVSP